MHVFGQVEYTDCPYYYLAVVQRGHDERLRQVIQVLAQNQLVVAVVAAAAVQQPPLHARTKSTQRVTLELSVGSAVDDGVGQIVVRHSQALSKRSQRK